MPVWIKVNPIGVLAGALTYLLTGAVLYSHLGFGRFWPNLTLHMQKQAGHMPLQVYTGAFLGALLTAWVMGCLIRLFHIKTQSAGALTGFLVWMGFIVPTISSPVLFGKKPLDMFWLDSLHYLIAYTLIGWIAAKFNVQTSSSVHGLE